MRSHPSRLTCVLLAGAGLLLAGRASAELPPLPPTDARPDPAPPPVDPAWPAAPRRSEPRDPTIELASPPVEVPDEGPPARVIADRAPKPVAPSLPWVLTLGPGVLGSSLGGHAVAALGADLPAGRYAWLSAFAQIAITSRSIERSFPLAPPLSSRVQAHLIGGGVTLPLVDARRTIVPRIGAGWGLAFLRVSPDPVPAQDPAALAPGKEPLTTGKAQTLASPFPYATAGASVRVSGSWRVSVEGLGGINVGEFVVRYAGAPVAYWGRPFGSIALRAEVNL